MAQLLIKAGGGVSPKSRELFQQLGTRAAGIGWGYGDVLRNQVSQLETELAGE